MSALSESPSRLDRSVAWLLDLLGEELAPYPGRGALVARMVISSVILLLIVMTFRMPGAALGGYYTLLLSRESPRATLAGALELIVSFGAGIAYVLLSSLLFFGSPVLHFLWVIVTLFLIFFVIRVLRSYSAAAGFGFLIATCIPVWDRVQSSELSVEATLWTGGSVLLGAVVTVAVEYVWDPFQRYGPFEQGLLQRWQDMREVLRALAAGQAPGEAGRKLTQFAATGVSSLRRLVLRAGRRLEFVEQAGSMLTITEHLVDLTAALLHVHPGTSRLEEHRINRAAAHLRHIEQRFREPGYRPASEDLGWVFPSAPSVLPLLPEIERNIAMLEQAFGDSSAVGPRIQAANRGERMAFIRHDTFTNRDHLRFALKGCLATTLCYVTYNAVGWPGLNTSVATCMVTALSSIGSSRQKQILRISGAIVGGIVFGMGAQAALLPNIDSITGFALFFASVTAIAAWFATTSARLSYFGLQIALAFFLVHLQDFAFQTSLTIARDRVFGILLGLIAMWLVFDLLGGVRAADQMVAQLRLALLRLADLQELSLSPAAEAIPPRAQSLREELTGIFAGLNTEADAVLLETGDQREQDLLLREQVLALQPSLRSLLLFQVTTLQYRREKLLHELPPAIANAQRQFDVAAATVLRELARTYPEAPTHRVREAYSALDEALHRHYGKAPGELLSPSGRAVLTLAEEITGTIETLAPAAE